MPGCHDRDMSPGKPVAVNGAYGHTGRFLVTELRRRGRAVVLSGRDPRPLEELAAGDPGTEARPASLDSPAELDRAVRGVAAVVNCAGPFGDTPPALLDAALRARVPYLDVAGETLVAWRVFTGGRLHLRTGDTPPPPGRTWAFPPPFGERAVAAEFPTADVVTVARHLPTR